MTSTLKNEKVKDFASVVDLFTKEEMSQLPREAAVKPIKKKERRKTIPPDVYKRIEGFLPPPETKVDDFGLVEKLFSPTEIKELGPPVVKPKPPLIVVGEELPEGDFSDVEKFFLHGTQPLAVTETVLVEKIPVLIGETPIEIPVETAKLETPELLKPKIRLAVEPADFIRPNNVVISMLPEKRNIKLAWNPEKPVCACGCRAFQADLCKYHWHQFVKKMR